MIYAIAIYLIIGAFLAGKNHKEHLTYEESWWEQFLVFVLLVLFTPIDVLWEFTKRTCVAIDDVIQLRFYLLYLRGGFKSFDTNRLYNLDQVLFVKEYLRPNSLITKHYQFIVGLIFKQNRYARRKWEVVDNKVNEVNP